MKIILTAVLLVIVSSFSIGQVSKTVIVTSTPKEVPTGKKWILEAGKTTRVQIDNSVFRSGSLCNALFTSIPRMIPSINKGSFFKPTGYMLIFKEPEKVPYTNDYTFDLQILSIVDKDFSFDEFESKQPEEVGQSKIEFKAGEKVFIGSCLMSIEMMEIDMTPAELMEIKKQEEEKAKLNQLKLDQFNIPINPEKYVEPGTKPVFHDNKLKSIIFPSAGVLYKSPDSGWAMDDVSTWTLSLNSETFNLESSNGIDKNYTVLKMEYFDEMKSLKVELGNSNKVLTHNLLISWNNSFNAYTVILSSVDKSEEYQFQEVNSTEKQFQN
jgi:hypothetical protein